MPTQRDQFREDVRFRVLRLLQERPDYSQRQLALALGVSLGAINYCINALVTTGSVKMRRFGSSSNKMGYAYILTPAGVAEKAGLLGAFVQRKRVEFEIIRSELEDMQREYDLALRVVIDNDLPQRKYGHHQ